MKAVAYKCPHCKDTIYSRAQHDFHWCSCKSIAIDGGPDHTIHRFLWEKNVDPEKSCVGMIETGATKKELFNDWYTETNKYGIIKQKAKKK